METKANDTQPATDAFMSLNYVPRFGYKTPAEFRFGTVAAFDEANAVLPRDQWREHDDLAPFWPAVEAQQNNNCTAASLACGAFAAFKAAGVECPRLSWAFNYSLRNGGRDEGAFCRDLAIDFMNVGIAPAVAVPDSRIFRPAGGWPPEILAAAAKWKALEVYQCLTFDHVGSALSQDFVVYHGFCLGRNGVMNPGPSGRVAEYDGQLANGHAMCSRGLTKRFGDWRTVTPNTWGTGYGDQGVGYWPESYFWAQRGNFVNLDCYAIRAVKRVDPLPVAG